MSAQKARRGSRMYPENVAITDQLLAALAEESPLPASTSALMRKAGVSPAMQGTVLRLLNRLATLGEVEKFDLPDQRCRYWRRLTAPAGLPEVTW